MSAQSVNARAQQVVLTTSERPAQGGERIVSEIATFIYDGPPPESRKPLPPICCIRVGNDDFCYVGRLNEAGDGYEFDGKETALLMPHLWEGDNA